MTSLAEPSPTPAALPIACGLDPAALPERLAEMRTLGDDALVAAEVAGTTAELRFSADPGVRDRLAAIVAAESSCCAFLALALHDEPAGIRLTAGAPEGAEPVLAEWVAAFTARAG